MARKAISTNTKPVAPTKASAKKAGAKDKPAVKKAKKKDSTRDGDSASNAKYPRHPLERALRLPRAILDQNAGKASSIDEVASFVGIKVNGPFGVEISSAIKFGLLERPDSGKVQPTALARKILRPQDSADELEGLREALLNAPDLSAVYAHYRGENLPDDKFLKNTVIENFRIPADKFEEFKQIFIESLDKAQLIERHGEKVRVLDISSEGLPVSAGPAKVSKALKIAGVDANDTCFVMQPFASPLGGYYEKIYAPAIEKAGLRPVRADADIFGTGKIMDQVWEGINAAKVLVAELTGRNPNVFYELGLAHALEKPVVLVCADGKNDVPFDLQHIRVIYYDTNDPFWGQKLVDKVAENIVSALKNPREATFKNVSP